MEKSFCVKIWRNFHAAGQIKTSRSVCPVFDHLIPVQEKGRRIPVHILPNVEDELKKLTAEGHIEKLDNCTDDVIIAPIVITAKKDGSVKLALDANP